MIARRAATSASSLPALLITVLASCSASVTQPNIVLMLTDDQDLLFDSTSKAMPYTKKLLGGGGTTFVNAFAHTPVCCPSRGQILTGKYMHNLKAADATVHTCMRCACTRPNNGLEHA